MANASDDFTAEEVDRARRYHRPLYWSTLGDLTLTVAVLGMFAFSPVGDAVHRWLDGLPWWLDTVLFAWVVLAAGFAAHLPLSYWRGYVREKRWGFSTQTVSGWAIDRMKGLAVGAVITGGLLTGFVGVARTFPSAWPWVLAPAGAFVVLVLTFVAPVVLEPIFNRFAPLADRTLARDLLGLADAVGVPVKEVLVADASRRTKKENAYVSGIGRTRRVVIYDTLLQRAEPLELRLVTAHELGHRRMRHVAKGTALGMAGLVAGVVILWALLRSVGVLAAIGATSAGDPRVVPFVLLVATALEVVAAPFETTLSRRWETNADRFSLDHTGELTTFESTHRALAISNLSDLDPPRALYLLLFTHPTPPERIANARRWAAATAGRAEPRPPSPPTTA